MNRTVQIVGSLAVIAVVMVLGLAAWGCYPKDCDPAKDPLRCECPPGPCGPYPNQRQDAAWTSVRDAGADR